METVLIVGSTGNIGASAIHAALRSKLHVLAVVRNQASAEKLFRNVGTRDGIMTVEADIMSDQGVKGVVEKVRKGKLPAFQHVYAAGKSMLRRRLLYNSILSNEESDCVTGSWRVVRYDVHT